MGEYSMVVNKVWYTSVDTKSSILCSHIIQTCRRAALEGFGFVGAFKNQEVFTKPGTCFL